MDIALDYLKPLSGEEHRLFRIIVRIEKFVTELLSTFTRVVDLKGGNLLRYFSFLSFAPP